MNEGFTRKTSIPENLVYSNDTRPKVIAEDYQLKEFDSVVFVDPASESTINLHLKSAMLMEGKIYEIKNIGEGTAKVFTSNAELFATINANSSITLISKATPELDWVII